MFQLNELVIYGNIGVCKIVEIGTPDFAMADNEKLYYYLEPLYQKGVLYAPVDSNVAIRAIISEEEANSLLEYVVEAKIEPIKQKSMQQVTKYYQEIIDSHDCYKLVELTKRFNEKRITNIRDNKKLGQIDKKFIKKSEELLFGEMAVALGLEKDEVAELVYKKMNEENQDIEL